MTASEGLRDQTIGIGIGGADFSFGGSPWSAVGKLMPETVLSSGTRPTHPKAYISKTSPHPVEKRSCN